jgi:lipid-A-disaccharide synthase-like uncharacterized protein
VRWTLLVAFGAFLFVGSWLAVGDDGWRSEAGGSPPRFEWVIDGRKLAVEVRPGPEPEGFEYRLRGGDHAVLGWLSASRFQALVVAETERSARRHVVLRFFDASSWASFGWVLLGLTGQLCFFGRMFLQWLASERASASVVPPVFWWLSLGGGACLLGYFVWRLDPIGVLGQSTGVAVYARNLWLLRQPHARPDAGAPADAQSAGSIRERSAESIPRTSTSSRSKLA